MVLAVVSTVGMYSVAVITAVTHGEILEYQLSQFDLNGDGAFFSEEQTPEQQTALNALINNVGRNMTVFFGIPVALVFSGLVFMAAFILKRRLPLHLAGRAKALMFHVNDACISRFC